MRINTLINTIKAWTTWLSFCGHFQIHFLENENDCNLIQTPQKFVPDGPIANESALVLEGAWCQTGNKPLLKPMTEFIDASMHHRINKIYMILCDNCVFHCYSPKGCRNDIFSPLQNIWWILKQRTLSESPFNAHSIHGNIQSSSITIKSNS